MHKSIALYIEPSDPEITRRHTSALLHLCLTRGWTPTIACRSVRDVAAVLAAREVETVVAVAPIPALVEAVTAAGGTLELVRPGPANTTAPAGLAMALGEMVRSGRISADDAAVLLFAAGPSRPAPADPLHRRPARPA